MKKSYMNYIVSKVKGRKMSVVKEKGSFSMI